MNEDEIISFIVQNFEGVQTTTANGDTFFFYGEGRMFPFVTLVMSDFNDSFSALNRPGVFRLNIGVHKQTYQALFGAQTPQSQRAPAEGAAASAASDLPNDAERTYDFTVLDRLLPHPVYGRQYWLCILNPSLATFATQVRPLLTEAYELATGTRSRRASHA